MQDKIQIILALQTMKQYNNETMEHSTTLKTTSIENFCKNIIKASVHWIMHLLIAMQINWISMEMVLAMLIPR